MSVTEPTMIGLSEKAHALLSQMKDDNFFIPVMNLFRFFFEKLDDAERVRCSFNLDY